MSGVLVVMQQHAGDWHRMSWETLAAGQQLAAQLGQTVSAAVVGQAGELSGRNFTHPALEQPLRVRVKGAAAGLTIDPAFAVVLQPPHPTPLIDAAELWFPRHRVPGGRYGQS